VHYVDVKEEVQWTLKSSVEGSTVAGRVERIWWSELWRSWCRRWNPTQAYFKKEIIQTHRTSKYKVSIRQAPGSDLVPKVGYPDNLFVVFPLPYTRGNKQNRSTKLQVTFSQNNHSWLLFYCWFHIT